jgi:chaperonin GroES
MNFIPLGERVLVERKEEETTTTSGIIIPDNAKEKPLTGTVVTVSKTVQDRGELNSGDTVVFAKYSGTEITLDGKEYLVLNNSKKSDEILGVIK